MLCAALSAACPGYLSAASLSNSCPLVSWYPRSCLLPGVTSLLIPPSLPFLNLELFLSLHMVLNHTRCLSWGWKLLMTRDKLLLVSSCGSCSCKSITFTPCFIIRNVLSSVFSHLVFRPALWVCYYYYHVHRSLEVTVPAYKGKPLPMNY